MGGRGWKKPVLPIGLEHEHELRHTLGDAVTTPLDEGAVGWDAVGLTDAVELQDGAAVGSR